MEVWDTATLVVLMTCWLNCVSCQDLTHNENYNPQTNPSVTPETNPSVKPRIAERASHRTLRHTFQEEPTRHLQPPMRIGFPSNPPTDVENQWTQGISPKNTENETPHGPIRQGDGDPRPERLGAQDTTNPLEGGAEDHAESAKPRGHESTNLSEAEPEDRGHSHFTVPGSPEPQELPGAGTEEDRRNSITVKPGSQGPKKPPGRGLEEHSDPYLAWRGNAEFKNVSETTAKRSEYSPDRGVPDHSDHGTEDEEDLCHSLCLCMHDDSVVSCEHEHVTEDHVHELKLYPGRLPDKVKKFRAIGFDELEILPGTFAERNLSIERIIFKDIGKLTLHPRSLYFHKNSNGNTKVEVTFEDCAIPGIPEGAITQDVIRQDDQGIELGLEDTRYLTLDFDRCSIEVIAKNAIANAHFRSFSIRNSEIHLMKARSIDTDVYEQFELAATAVPKLVRNSICIRTDGVAIFSHNVLSTVEGFAFNVISDSQVLFESNRVRELEAPALLGIVPSEDARGASIVFLNNTVETAQPGSLMISPGYMAHERKVLNNKFDVPCMCNISEVFGGFLSTSNFEDVIFVEVMDNSLCMNEDSGNYQKVEEFMASECRAFPLIKVIVASLVLAVILILIVVIIICWQRVKKLKEENSYATEGSTRSFSTLRSCPPLSPGVQGPPSSGGRISPSWIMGVPEIKTYQETEVHIPCDRTETMDSSKLSYHGSPYHSYKSSEERTPRPIH